MRDAVDIVGESVITEPAKVVSFVQCSASIASSHDKRAFGITVCQGSADGLDVAFEQLRTQTSTLIVRMDVETLQIPIGAADQYRVGESAQSMKPTYQNLSVDNALVMSS